MQRVLIIVPGHGRPERTSTLLRSLQGLMAEPWPTGGEPSCIVFIYESSSAFWELQATRNLREKAGCSLELRPGTVFMHFLTDGAIRRAVDSVQPQYVLFLLDDIALGGSGIPTRLGDLLRVAERNQLDVVSPAVVGTPSPYQCMWPSRPRRPGAVGRLVSFIEWQATLFTLEAFDVLRGMVQPDLSTTWGYDELFPGCFRRALGRLPRMGVVDAMHAKHTGSGLSSSTLDERDVYRQELALLGWHKQHYNITPAPVRSRLGYLFY